MKKKTRRLAQRQDHLLQAKPVRISQNFVVIRVPVPEAEVDVTLPASMTFFVDTRFTSGQRGRIRTLIVRNLAAWRFHYAQIADGGRSSYQTCVNTYARFNLTPVWFDGKIATGAAAAAVQMDGLTRMIVANGFGRAPRAFIMYQVPSSTVPNFTIKALNASNPDVSPLSVTINPRVIARTDLSNTTLTGSLQHAWLHREGYRHPTGKYTSYFAGEASMCLMRNNAIKPIGVPDSRFTQFLD